MKKLISIILSFVILFSIGACGSGSDELAAMQAQIDALSQQINSSGNSELEALRLENEELKTKIREGKPVWYSVR